MQSDNNITTSRSRLQTVLSLLPDLTLSELKVVSDVTASLKQNIVRKSGNPISGGKAFNRKVSVDSNSKVTSKRQPKKKEKLPNGSPDTAVSPRFLVPQKPSFSSYLEGKRFSQRSYQSLLTKWKSGKASNEELSLVLSLTKDKKKLLGDFCRDFSVEPNLGSIEALYGKLSGIQKNLEEVIAENARTPLQVTSVVASAPPSGEKVEEEEGSLSQEASFVSKKRKADEKESAASIQLAEMGSSNLGGPL